MLHMARCARCALAEQKDRKDRHITCGQCGTEKDILAYPAILIKQAMAGRRMGDAWKCFDCYYPVCKGWKGRSCNKRPLHPPSHNSYEDGQYLCEQCRFPLCMGRDGNKPCTQERQKSQKYHIKEMPVWYCDKHRPQQPQACKACGAITRTTRTATMHQDIAGDWFCKQCAENHLVECASCGKQVNRNSYAEALNHKRQELWRCDECRHPPCAECGKKVEDVWHQGRGAQPFCRTCRADADVIRCIAFNYSHISSGTME